MKTQCEYCNEFAKKTVEYCVVGILPSAECNEELLDLCPKCVKYFDRKDEQNQNDALFFQYGK